MRGLCPSAVANPRIWNPGYAFMRLPMGWKWAPYLATAVACVLWAEAARRAAVRLPVCDVWVDDSILASATRAEVAAASDRAREVCAEVGAVVKKRSGIVSDFEYVGVHWDLVNKRWRLAPAWAAEFLRRAEALEGSLHPELGDWWSIVGGAVWIAYALRLPMAALAPSLRHLSDHVNVQPPAALSSLVPVPQSCADTVLALARFASAEWVSLPGSRPSRALLAVDASTVGIGVCESGVRWYSVPHVASIPHTPIQRAEARALAVSLLPFASLTDATITILSDNLGLVMRLARWSAAVGVADITMWLWRWAAQRRLTLRVGWLSTLLNPADGPSRLRVAASAPCAPFPPRVLRAAWFPPAAGSIAPVVVAAL